MGWVKAISFLRSASLRTAEFPAFQTGQKTRQGDLEMKSSFKEVSPAAAGRVKWNVSALAEPYRGRPVRLAEEDGLPEASGALRHPHESEIRTCYT